MLSLGRYFGIQLKSGAPDSLCPRHPPNLSSRHVALALLVSSPLPAKFQFFIMSQQKNVSCRRQEARVALIVLLIYLCSLFLLYSKVMPESREDSPTWMAPRQNISPQELTGNPEPGSISCPSPLLPVYNRTIFHQTSHRNTPKLIHVSMKLRCLPHDLFDNTERWKTALPEHSFYFHDNYTIDRLLNLPWIEFPQLKWLLRCVMYDGAMKIDIWRILILYKLGGLYCDIDMYPTELMNETHPITSSDDSFFLSDGVSQQLFAKGLIYSHILHLIFLLSTVEQTFTVVFCYDSTTPYCILHHAGYLQAAARVARCTKSKSSLCDRSRCPEAWVR